MAEEAPKTTPTATAQEEPAVVVTDVTPAAVKTNTTVPEEPEPEPEKKPVEETPPPETELSKPAGTTGDGKIPESGSFKEESTIVAELPEAEKKALQELKQLIQDALNNHELSAVPLNPPKEEEKPQQPIAEEKAPASDDNNKATPEEGQKEQEVSKSEPVAVAADADVSPPPPAAAEADQPTKTEEREAEKKEEKEETEVKETKVAAPNSTDDDGAKTVEAIEETVVAVAAAVSSSVPEEQKASTEEESKVASPQAQPEEVSIWGVPLLADERSDVILLKFLRARDFKVKDAFAMIKNTIRWRKEFGIDKLLEEDLGDELEKAVYMHGVDKEGHPVCYNIYGEFQNKELYKKTFSDEEKRHRFLRWRIQFLEKSIRKLDFNPGGICTIVQVNDLKNSPGPAKWELRQATKQALYLLQDNYPEFVAKQVFINVPWWYLAVNRMISPFLTQRTKSKFVFAGPSKSAETLLRYIAPEQLPVKYGGLSKDGEFGITDAVTEITVRPAAKHTVEFPVTENCLLSWELRVIGWDISYGAEFVPSSEGSYTVIIQKTRKVASSEEPVLCNNYKIGEPGKVVLTIDNQGSKKKKLLYRLKTKPSSSD